MDNNNECWKSAPEPQGSCTANTEIKGMLVFYIDVGQLPPFKAEAFVERWKDNCSRDGFFEKLKAQGYEMIFIPVRPNSQTRVEMVPLSKDCMPMITHHLDPDFLTEVEDEGDEEE
jgi:hypothetical protein